VGAVPWRIVSLASDPGIMASSVRCTELWERGCQCTPTQHIEFLSVHGSQIVACSHLASRYHGIPPASVMGSPRTANSSITGMLCVCTIFIKSENPKGSFRVVGNVIRTITRGNITKTISAVVRHSTAGARQPPHSTARALWYQAC
jgi:hypothetical protein